MLVRLRTGWALAFAQLQLRLKDGTIGGGGAVMLATIVAGATLVLAGGTVIDGYGNDPIPDGIVVIEGDRILAVGGVGPGRHPGGRGSRLDRGHDRAAGPVGHAGGPDAPRPRRLRALERDLRAARRARRDADRGAPAARGGRDERARRRGAARGRGPRARPGARADHRRARPLRLRPCARASSRRRARATGSGKSAARPTCAPRYSASRMRVSTTCCSRTSRCGRPRRLEAVGLGSAHPRTAGARLAEQAGRRRARRGRAVRRLPRHRHGRGAVPGRDDAGGHRPAHAGGRTADRLDARDLGACSTSSR